MRGHSRRVCSGRASSAPTKRCSVLTQHMMTPQDNTPIICNRPHHDARFNPDIDWAPGSGVKTVACCPMTTVHSKVVGVIQVSNKVIGGYSEEDLHFLDLLGKQAVRPSYPRDPMRSMLKLPSA